MMHSLKSILIIAFLLSTTAAVGEARVEMINDLVPKDWILVYYALGDINNDGKEDAIMVVENTNKSYLKRNVIVGPSVLNMNPRQVMVLFQTDTGYKERLRFSNGFPTEHQFSQPCMADPLVESGEIKINKGDVKFALSYKLKCRGHDRTNHAFDFRYENDRFRLVKFKAEKIQRISGEASEYSIDYATGQKKTVTGLNIYEKTPKRTHFETVAINKTFYLDEMSLACPADAQHACDKVVNQALLDPSTAH